MPAPKEEAEGDGSEILRFVCFVFGFAFLGFIVCLGVKTCIVMDAHKKWLDRARVESRETISVPSCGCDKGND